MSALRGKASDMLHYVARRILLMIPTLFVISALVLLAAGVQPAGRQPAAEGADLDHLATCWDREGMVDEAGAIVYGWLRAGGTRGSVLAALGSALLAEDAEFHWYQVLEAGVRQAQQWPEGSEEAALVLTAVTRFVTAHTPTRRRPRRRPRWPRRRPRNPRVR